MAKMLLHMRRAAARAASTAVHSTRNGAPTASIAAMRQTRALPHTAAAVALHGDRVCVRSFQTSAMLLKQHTTDVTKGAKQSVAAALASKKDDDGEEEEEEEEDEEEDEGSDSDDDDEEDSDDEDDDDDDEEAEIDPENPAAQYIGVTYYPSKVKKYSAELSIDGHVISGGDYWTALDAAKGYDELVDLYCDLDTPRNFPSGSSEAAEDAAAGVIPDAATAEVVGDWEVPEVGKRHADMIPPIPKTYLTLDEVLAALEKEKAVNVYTVDLAGKSSLAEYMIFTTGRSQAHMRRMADMMIASMRARQLEDEFSYSVEGRDCDDWMIADCNNIVVHFMREDTRRILNLEDHWENMVDDKHRVYGEMTEDEYMDKFGTSELMEYLEDEDHSNPDDNDTDGSGVEWK